MLNQTDFLWLLQLEPALHMSLFQRYSHSGPWAKPSDPPSLIGSPKGCGISPIARNEWIEVRAGCWPWSNEEDSPP